MTLDRLDAWGVRLMVLTDRTQLRPGRRLVPTIRECVGEGLTHVVLRELDRPEPVRAALVAELAAVGATVVSARTALPGAVGVHLPAVRSTDQPGQMERQSPGADHSSPVRPDWSVLRFGRSCHSREEVVRAAAEGASYAFLGPYADGGSKPGRIPLAPHDFAGQPVPVYALGGVTPANARAALDAGAHGVAVMGAVMASDDPARVVAELLEAVG